MGSLNSDTRLTIFTFTFYLSHAIMRRLILVLMQEVRAHIFYGDVCPSAVAYQNHKNMKL